MIYVSKYSLYVSLKLFDYSHNGNKIDNLLYAIMTCQVQLIFPCDWNFFFKKNWIIVYMNTGRHKDWLAIRKMLYIWYKKYMYMCDRFYVKTFQMNYLCFQLVCLGGHFKLIFIRLFKSLFCPIEMTKNTKIQSTINCIK